MSIIDSRHDRRMASSRIDTMKATISALREHIDLIFAAHPNMPIAIQRQLAEIDIDLNAAAIALGAAQAKVLKL